jgi:6-phosphogluconolactonase
MNNVRLEVYPDQKSLMRAAAEKVVALGDTALTTRGRFTFALSGGKTPRPLYQLLASDEFLPLLDWQQTQIFWGDERCVPPEHPDSNYRMARELLLDYVPLPMDHIYRIKGELEPYQAAEQYDERLHTFFSGRAGTPEAPLPRFDLVLLGIGDDGHTASLFPHTPGLTEDNKWVTAHWVEKLDAWRLTLTPTALNAASHLLFVVEGANKAEALKAIFDPNTDPMTYPAKLVQPRDGTVTWLVDEAAARLLNP